MTKDASVTAIFIQVPTTPPPATISVHVSPEVDTIITGGWARFTATVDGTLDHRVAWEIAEGRVGGSIDSTGAYTAPANPGTYHVVASSRADNTRIATAVVTVTAPPANIEVIIEPGDIAAASNVEWQFKTQVTGTSNTSVTWSVLEGDAGGTIDQDGFYISPVTAGVFHVVATSNADRSVSATATVRTDAPLIDNGGPIQPVAVVHAIWWGSAAVFGNSPAALAQMFAGFDGTPYLRTLDQYMRGAKTSVSFAGTWFDSSSPPSILTAGSEVGAEVCSVLDANHVAPRSDGFYVVFVDNSPPGAASWHDFASCHGVSLTVAYIANSEAGVPQGSQPPDVCGRTQMVDAFSLAAAHELFEAMTDVRGNAWIDSAGFFGGEVDDKCASIPTFTCAVSLNDGSAWRLPYVWSNAVTGCVLGTP